MNETKEEKEQTEPVAHIRPHPADPSGWQAPAYEVVDTALEVTAYSLSSR